MIQVLIVKNLIGLWKVRWFISFSKWLFSALSQECFSWWLFGWSTWLGRLCISVRHFLYSSFSLWRQWPLLGWWCKLIYGRYGLWLPIMSLAAFGYGKHTKLSMPSSNVLVEEVAPGNPWLDNSLAGVWVVSRAITTDNQDGVKGNLLINQLQMWIDRPLKVQVAQDFLDKV